MPDSLRSKSGGTGPFQTVRSSERIQEKRTSRWVERRRDL